MTSLPEEHRAHHYNSVMIIIRAMLINYNDECLIEKDRLGTLWCGLWGDGIVCCDELNLIEFA